MSRHAERELAVKMLYSKLINPNGMENYLPETPSLKDHSYATQLVMAVKENELEINQTILSAASNWSLPQMNKVDLVIMQVAIAEIKHMEANDLNKSIVINEAIELARTYSGEAATKFVNGVLNAAI